MIVLQILALGAAMMVALFYFGYGAARVLMPARFDAWRILLTPFFGSALVVVWDYAALFFGIDLTRATWALLALATLLNASVLTKQWRAQKSKMFHVALPREQYIVIAFAFLAFLAAVAPLMRYGYATVIGENWDYEFYLPLADALRVMPTAALENAPPNPLLTTILSRHILPLPMGFSYLHATLDVLTQLQALDSFAVLMGVLRALGVLASFVFFRATLKMSARASVFAAALLALNGLLLWFTYWSFGLHLASLALMPVTLLFGAHALMLRDATRIESARAIFTAGFFLGALNVMYHPALVAVALPLFAIGAHQLITQKKRAAVLLRGIAMVALALLFSFPALLHIQDFLREYYGRAPLAIGLREFVPLSDGYGLSLYILNLAVGHTIPTPWLYDALARVWNFAAPLLTLVAALSSLYALWRLRADTERCAVWYLVVGASVFYVALFRLPFLRPYPYGFIKSLSLVSYVLIALAVQGTDYVLQMADDRWRIVRRGSMLLLGAFAVLTLATFVLSVEQYFKPRPAFFDADALKLRALSTHVPREAEIFLTDNAQVQEIPMGLAAYALQQNNLYGNVTTGYGALNNAPAARVYDYALLARGEDPTMRGYENKALWQNETFALYPRAQGVVAHNALNAQVVAPRALTFTLGAQEIISGTKNISTTPGARDVTIAFASFVPQRAEVVLGDAQTRVELQPGVTTLTRANVSLPAMLMVTPTVTTRVPDADAALFVPYIQLAETRATQNMTATLDATLVRCTNENARALDARCFVVNPRAENLMWRWIVRGTPAGTREERVMAQTETNAAPRARVEIGAGIEGAMRFQFDDAAPQIFSAPALPDGKYRGTLEIFRGAVLLARIPLYTFEIKARGLTRAMGASPLFMLAP